jgi:hypothetical protein
MKAIQFRGKILDGKAKVYQPELMQMYIESLKEGTEIKYTLGVHRNTRSNEQNRYMWGVVYMMISERTGYFVEEVHHAMQIKFLTIEETPLHRVRSTSTLDTLELEEYLSKIRTWASLELIIYIPLPNENTCPVF